VRAVVALVEEQVERAEHGLQAAGESWIREIRQHARPPQGGLAPRQPLLDRRRRGEECLGHLAHPEAAEELEHQRHLHR